MKLKYRSTTIQEATERNKQQELTGDKKQPATKDNEQEKSEATGNRSNSERKPVADPATKDDEQQESEATGNKSNLERKPVVDDHKQQLKSHRQLR